MENASKALIIAGAILISILLISVGIMIMNASNGVTSGAQDQMDAVAIQQFNSRWDAYNGSQSGAAVKNLIAAIRVNNKSDNKPNTITVQIAKDVGGCSTAGAASGSTDDTVLGNIYGSLSSTALLRCKFDTNDQGFIYKVTITAR